MKLLKIHVKGFKSIYDDLTLDFSTTVKGFWRINGPVGSGKTTIGEAIIFGLYGDIHGKVNGDLTSWGENHTLVEIWCESKGRHLYIKRDINHYGGSSVYAEIDGEELKYTNKRNAQKQLEEEYYDVSRITIELLCIINFNNFKSLATLNPADTRQFLDQVFGFYILTNYSDICKNQKNSSKDLLQDLQHKRNSIKAQIDRVNKMSEMTIVEGNISEIVEENKTLNTQLRQTVSDSTRVRNEYNKQIDELSKKLGSIKALGINKAKEIKLIEKGTCPTCGAPIDQAQLDIKKQEKQLLLEQYTDIDNKIKELSSERIKKDQEYEDAIHNLNVKISNNNTLHTKLTEQQKRLSISSSMINDLNEEFKTLSNKIDQTQIDVNQWNQLYDILSIDVRYKILSSFIPLINKYILEYTLQFQLPFIVTFDESFKCSLNMYGVDHNIPLSSLSTGQLKVVDISIILGVLKTIMSSTNFNVCLLDELLSNMDIELRQIICKVLKENLKDNQTLFIISHTDLDDTHFDGAINVSLEYKDEIHKKSNYNIVSISK